MDMNDLEVRRFAEKLVKTITRNLERESALLDPNPSVYMRDPYALLDLIRDTLALDEETIDRWMCEEQNISQED